MTVAEALQIMLTFGLLVATICLHVSNFAYNITKDRH